MKPIDINRIIFVDYIDYIDWFLIIDFQGLGMPGPRYSSVQFIVIIAKMCKFSSTFCNRSQCTRIPVELFCCPSYKTPKITAAMESNNHYFYVVLSRHMYWY